uniref:Uncharacterized protein LOC114332630 n=1 Tax=Diabrotica virgifera virgifera TaxID=50390 RepID=A0A6P7G0R1_DIAVI
MLKCALFLLCALHIVYSKISLSRFNDPKAQEKIASCTNLYKLELGDLLENLEKGNGDENMKKYNMCLYNAVGAVDGNNKANREVITGYLKLFYPENFQEILTKCIKDVVINAEEAYQMSLCTNNLVKN